VRRTYTISGNSCTRNPFATCFQLYPTVYATLILVELVRNTDQREARKENALASLSKVCVRAWFGSRFGTTQCPRCTPRTPHRAVFVRLLHAVEADNTGAVPVCTGLCTCIAAECVCVKLVSIGDCAIVYM